jgi:hypothetical protein
VGESDGRATPGDACRFPVSQARGGVEAAVAPSRPQTGRAALGKV